MNSEVIQVQRILITLVVGFILIVLNNTTLLILLNATKSISLSMCSMKISFDSSLKASALILLDIAPLDE